MTPNLEFVNQLHSSTLTQHVNASNQLGKALDLVILTGLNTNHGSVLDLSLYDH